MNEVVDEPSGGSDERIAWSEMLALAMVLVTFAVAIHETRGRSWPPRQDFHREMGATQLILEYATHPLRFRSSLLRLDLAMACKRGPGDVFREMPRTSSRVSAIVNPAFLAS